MTDSYRRLRALCERRVDGRGERHRDANGSDGRGRDVVDDRGDALPEALLRIDADAFEVRLHEFAHRIQMAEEDALPGLDMLDRAAPFGDCRAGDDSPSTALAPDANDEYGGTVFEQRHHDLPVARRTEPARSVTAASPLHHTGITDDETCCDADTDEAQVVAVMGSELMA